MADQDKNDPGKLHIDADWKAQARAEKERLAQQQQGGQGQDKPKIHVDQDWKSQAQAEKQRLAEQSAQAKAQDAEQPSPGGRGMPPADFQTLVSTMATQALFAMGAIPDPTTGQRMAHLDLARHHIDMLGVLEEKTRGNLKPDEEKLLKSAVYELRMQYLQVSKAALAAAQEQGGETPQAPGT